MDNAARLEHLRRMEAASREPSAEETIRVLEHRLALAVAEGERLQEQVRTLQASNTREVERRRAAEAWFKRDSDQDAGVVVGTYWESGDVTETEELFRRAFGGR